MYFIYRIIIMWKGPFCAGCDDSNIYAYGITQVVEYSVMCFNPTAFICRAVL